MYRVLKFGAAWCGPCRKLSEELKKTPIEIANVTVTEIDVDASEDLAEVYQITNVPTIIIKNEETNEVLKKHVGYLTVKQLTNLIKEVING